MPDARKWTYEERFIRNRELQFYMNARKENVRVEDGMLVIESRRERFRNHVYAIEWSPQRIDFFVDDTKYFSYTNEQSGEAAWPYDREHYLILNTAIGGTWGGQKGIDDSIFPQKFPIDYVRVYQRPVSGVSAGHARPHSTL